MPRATVVALSALAICCFAGNSLLCRAALADDLVDPATFTTVRLLAGAATLWLLVRLRSANRSSGAGGSWRGAVALFAYAGAFSFAYRALTAATGALLLFGAVQITMILVSRLQGERFGARQAVGSMMAVGGLIYLVLPGVAAPPLDSASLMLAAGVAWGAYTLFGRSARDAAAETAGNFLRAVPLTLLLSAVLWRSSHGTGDGLLLAAASGAVTSGLGYALWYAALPALRSITAATLQLSVPVFAGLGGALLLGEVPSVRLVVAGAAILGGIAVVISSRAPAETPSVGGNP